MTDVTISTVVIQAGLWIAFGNIPHTPEPVLELLYYGVGFPLYILTAVLLFKGLDKYYGKNGEKRDE